MHAMTDTTPVRGLTANAHAALTANAAALPIANLSAKAVEFTGTAAEAACAIQTAMNDRMSTHGGRDPIYTGLRSVRNKLDKLNAEQVHALPIGARVWDIDGAAFGISQPRAERTHGIIAPDDFPATYNNQPVSARPADHLVAVQWEIPNRWHAYFDFAEWVEPTAIAPAVS